MNQYDLYRASSAMRKISKGNEYYEDKLRIVSNERSVRLCSTDCDSHAETVFSYAAPMFDVTVSHRMFVKAMRCKKSDSNSVDMYEYGDVLRINPGKLLVELPIIKQPKSPKPFEHYPDGKEFSPPSTLINVLNFSLSSACTDETRSHICSVLFDSNCMVSTDGNRIHIQSSVIPIEKKLLIPFNKLSAVSSLMYGATKTNVCAQDESITFKIAKPNCEHFILCKEINAKYPPYEQAVPKDYIVKAIVESDILRMALNDKQLKGPATCLQINEYGIKIGTSHDTKESVSTILSSVKYGSGLSTGIDKRYLLEAISGYRGLVEIYANCELDPIRLELDTDRTAIIMPMRL